MTWRQNSKKERLHFTSNHRGHKPHRNDIRKFVRFFRIFIPITICLNIIGLFTVFSWIGRPAQFGIVIIVLLIGFIGSRFQRNFEGKIVHPIEKLKKGMSEVAEGNLDIEVKVDTHNDVGHLISSFNQMVRKLKESEQLKQEYEENRKLLVTNISHDLKTPITSIQGYIEVLQDGTILSDKKKSQYLDVIWKNAQYMNKLIDDLFLFSKLDMQKLDFDIEEVEINPFMADLSEEYKFDFHERGLEYIFSDLTEHTKVVKVDRKRLHQSIQNIVSNSLKYGDNENLQLEMILSSFKNEIKITIRDNGQGITKANLERIFERFYRVEDARTKNLESTGLGLSISKELIEAMGGKIEVESELGIGTSFHIYLRVMNTTN
ncbi:HAMP domain-containing histidine kinase [Arthrobacter citreus]|nr:HAMP domain-containing histidine kinase [Arthrobacter citreus]